MAIINIMSFKLGDNSEAQSTSGTFSVQNTVTRYGTGYALRVNPTTTAVGYHSMHALDTTGAPVNGSVATSYVRGYLRVASRPGSNYEQIISTRKSSGRKGALAINSSGNIVVLNKSNTVVTTGSSVLANDTWYRIDFKCGTGAAADYEVRIDGVSEVSGTADMDSSNCAGIHVGKTSNLNSQTVDYYWEDIVWDDSSYPSAGRQVLLVPNANGNYQTWSIGAGSDHYSAVNEIPHNSDTSYLAGALSFPPTDAETEALASFTGSYQAASIAVVKNIGVFKRDGASDGQLQLRLRSDATDDDTDAFATTSSYVMSAKLYATDPNTGLAWGASALDSIESGVRENSGVNYSRMTLCAAIVEFAPSTGMPVPFGGDGSVFNGGRTLRGAIR